MGSIVKYDYDDQPIRYEMKILTEVLADCCLKEISVRKQNNIDTHDWLRNKLLLLIIVNYNFFIKRYFQFVTVTYIL